MIPKAKILQSGSWTITVNQFFCTAVSVIDTKILSTSFSWDKAAAEEERTKRRKKKQRRKNLNGGRYGKKARI